MPWQGWHWVVSKVPSHANHSGILCHVLQQEGWSRGSPVVPCSLSRSGTPWNAINGDKPRKRSPISGALPRHVPAAPPHLTAPPTWPPPAVLLRVGAARRCFRFRRWPARHGGAPRDRGAAAFREAAPHRPLPAFPAQRLVREGWRRCRL